MTKKVNKKEYKCNDNPFIVTLEEGLTSSPLPHREIPCGNDKGELRGNDTPLFVTLEEGLTSSQGLPDREIPFGNDKVETQRKNTSATTRAFFVTLVEGLSATR